MQADDLVRISLLPLPRHSFRNLGLLWHGQLESVDADHDGIPDVYSNDRARGDGHP
jgi:hypothetical protein